MAKISRRSFLESAIAIGATAAWRFASPKTTTVRWIEQREFFPEGVASGDPDSSSVLLWTRHTPGTQQVTAEVAEDPGFAKVVAVARVPISAASDWTCRVLAGGLRYPRAGSCAERPVLDELQTLATGDDSAATATTSTTHPAIPSRTPFTLSSPPRFR